MKVSDAKKFKHSLLFPLIFIVVIWLIKLYEYFEKISFADYGIYPRTISGLKGIFFSPLLHGSFNHIMANTTTVFILLLIIFYFFSKIAYKVFFINYFLTGILVWILARPAYHIGASSLIYSLSFFIVVSGIIRNNRNLMALSLIIIFMYGSMIWGVLPGKPHISWESHLLGAVSGIFTAILYRNQSLSWIHYIKVYKFREFNNGNYEKL